VRRPSRRRRHAQACQPVRGLPVPGVEQSAACRPGVARRGCLFLPCPQAGQEVGGGGANARVCGRVKARGGSGAAAKGGEYVRGRRVVCAAVRVEGAMLQETVARVLVCKVVVAGSARRCAARRARPPAHLSRGEGERNGMQCWMIQTARQDRGLLKACRRQGAAAAARIR